MLLHGLYLLFTDEGELGPLCELQRNQAPLVGQPQVRGLPHHLVMAPSDPTL